MTRDDLYKMYESDPYLIDAVHIKAGEGLDTCTDDTWNIIKNHELYVFDFGYFSICRDDIVPRLGGFFLYPNFRTNEYKKKFIKELNSKMPSVYLSGLYNKNKRGIKFLASFGTIVTTNSEKTYFVFRQEKK